MLVLGILEAMDCDVGLHLEGKTHNAKEVAECFGVNTSTVYRLEKRMRETGAVETRVSQRGRKSALSQTDLQNIDQMIRAQPDITIHEI